MGERTLEKQESRANSLKELALLFLRLGTTAFGGPAVHIAMMREEVVNKRKWLSEEEFLDLMGATNLIPGPSSTELAIHIGLLRGGFWGLIVAGTCFIIPAVTIVLLLAWSYVYFGNLPQLSGILYAIKPVVIAIVLQALWGLAPTAIKSRFLGFIAVLSLFLSILKFNELAILFGIAISFALIKWIINSRKKTFPALSIFFTNFFVIPAQIAATPALTPGLWPIFLFFLKVGSLLFGSGYVLIVFLRADLVEKYKWLTETQLLDAIAVGQITPGPVFTTATFIGYLLAGFWGAIVATIGIFLPAFVLVLVSNPIIPRLRKSFVMGNFLDGVNAVSLALMGNALLQIVNAALVDFLTIALAIISAVLLIKFRINSTWLILGAVLIGLLIKLI